MAVWGKVVIGSIGAAVVGQLVGSLGGTPSPQQPTHESAKAQDDSDDEDAPSDQATKAADQKEVEAQKIADGSHCVVGWDNSMPSIKDSVKAGLRDPDSFEHIETVWTRMGKDGNFLLAMKFRAHNGFGGMNVEEADAIVNATTCDFKFVSGRVLMKKLKNYPV